MYAICGTCSKHGEDEECILKGRGHLRGLGVDWMIILNWIRSGIVCEGVDRIEVCIGSNCGFYKYDNELWGFLKTEHFLKMTFFWDVAP
jgi:hypothetical protein